MTGTTRYNSYITHETMRFHSTNRKSGWHTLSKCFLKYVGVFRHLKIVMICKCLYKKKILVFTYININRSSFEWLFKWFSIWYPVKFILLNNIWMSDLLPVLILSNSHYDTIWVNRVGRFLTDNHMSDSRMILVEQVEAHTQKLIWYFQLELDS